MELQVIERGSFICKHQGRIRVLLEKKVVQEVPLIHLESILVMDSSISFSTDVISVCCAEGIPIHFISYRGQAIASIYSAGLTGTVLTRRAQLLAYDSQTGITLAKAFVQGKLENQANLLKYIAKYRKETNAPLHEELMQVALEMKDHVYELEQIQGDKMEDIRFRIMSVEGRAAERYWNAIKQIIPDYLEWTGRETRGALDPFDSAINYGYGILYNRVTQALLLAGLDPYGGFLHADRPGKPSLVCDLIEEFRQTVVDRTIIGLVNKKFVIAQDAEHQLEKTTRLKIAEKINERMESNELYEQKRQPLRHILQQQARHIATFVREERQEYTPFIASW